MDALKIAFDSIIVGALALPWLYLLADLFFPFDESENAGPKSWPSDLLARVKGESLYPVAAVLLLALAYFLGSVVSRVAEDFFNDDDLGVPWTEDGIRARVYCFNHGEPWPITTGVSLPAVPPDVGRIQSICKNFQEALCARDPDKVASAVYRVHQMFHLQESALLLNGTDKVVRLNELHQQIIVLRGAAFNGLIACLLCLFGWNAKPRNWGPWEWWWGWRWILPLLLIAAVGAMLYKHFGLPREVGETQHFHWEIDDPPFMEFALLLLGGAGCSLLLKKPRGCCRYVFAFPLLVAISAIAYLSWWRTEIVYDREVINSFYAQSHDLLQAGTETKHLAAKRGRVDPKIPVE